MDSSATPVVLLFVGSALYGAPYYSVVWDKTQVVLSVDGIIRRGYV